MSLTSLSEVFSIVTEEGPQPIMLGNYFTKGSPLSTDKPNNGVLVMNKGLQNNNSGLTGESGKMEAPKSTIYKDALWCNYSKKPRYTKNCWKLRGKPQSSR